MRIALFEDWYVPHLFPLTYTRATFDLMLGGSQLIEKIRGELGPVDAVFVRDYLEPKERERWEGLKVNPREMDDDVLLVNGSLTKFEFEVPALDHSIFCGERLVVAHLRKSSFSALSLRSGLELTDAHMVAKLTESKVIPECKNLIEYPWQIVDKNGEFIRRDYKGPLNEGQLEEGVVVAGPPQMLRVEKGVRVEAGAFIDVRKGPVTLSEGAVVESGSRVTGPSFIGRDVEVLGAFLRENVTLGPAVRVGGAGEIEESVVHGYSNKYHFGFLGHSYVGEWVNLGAGTTNSDLKDTYGPVKVKVGGQKVNSGSMKVGCFIGDNAKTSIGTMIYTGKSVGVAAQLHGIIYSDVPSFTIWAQTLGEDPVEEYLDSVIETQRRMMDRRGVKQTRADVDLLRKIYEMTMGERKSLGVRKGKFSFSDRKTREFTDRRKLKGCREIVF